MNLMKNVNNGTLAKTISHSFYGNQTKKYRIREFELMQGPPLLRQKYDYDFKMK